MARSSLTNSFSNLNLSRRQIAILQEIILVGNQMSVVMSPEHIVPMPEEKAKLGRKWSYLMIEFAKTLL